MGDATRPREVLEVGVGVEEDEEVDGEEEEVEEVDEVRLIDFDIVMKHECKACHRDFRVPFLLPPSPPPPPSSPPSELSNRIRNLHINHDHDHDEEADNGDNAEERDGEEEGVSREAIEFGCDQLYDVCKYTMKVWD